MDPSGGEHGGSAGAGKAGKPKAEHDTGAKDTNARGDGAHRAEQPGDGATREGKCASVHAPKHAESGWGKLISHDAEVRAVPRFSRHCARSWARALRPFMCACMLIWFTHWT